MQPSRELWLKLGYSSLFVFLHRELGLSKGASHFRRVAAELIQRFPEVVEPLKDGRLCITSIVELAKVITPENRVEVLPRFFHASKQEAKAVAAEICPQEVVPVRVVVTAVAAAATRSLPPVASASVRQESAEVLPVELALASPPPAAPRTVAEPLTADLRRLHITVSKRFMEKLEAARDALSHSHPGADVEAVLEAGLDLLIERAAARKGLLTRPKTQRKEPARSRTSVEAAEGGARSVGQRRGQGGNVAPNPDAPPPRLLPRHGRFCCGGGPGGRRRDSERMGWARSGLGDMMNFAGGEGRGEGK
jgi:hypothetical protein